VLPAPSELERRQYLTPQWRRKDMKYISQRNPAPTSASVLSIADVQTLTEEYMAAVRALIESKLCPLICCSNFRQGHGKNNDYSLLEEYSAIPGIYRFIEPGGEILYVGEAGFSHGLKRRVVQNFTPGSSGGTFRKNLAADKFKNDQDAQAKAADWILTHTSVQLVGTPSDEHKYLERLAIEVFKPKYNK
jgi:hypothetical protein